MQRCPWPADNELMIQYHDTEWGVPVHEDVRHFEFLILEGAQAGLSWLTVLRKRENYRKAFDDFNPEKISGYGSKKIGELVKNPGIIRNRLKIESAVNNAKKFLEIQNEFGSFDSYIWRLVDNKPIINSWKKLSDIPAKTEVSDKISKDLKKRGFKFVGSTIMYSHMQAVGIVNDHLTRCFRYREICSSWR